jgi:DNA end-binding protein Ku
MPARSTWKGYLKLSLVSLPVKAYTASSSGGSEISLNQLHQECHSRIKYLKSCPIHGEISGDEIVSGYEYSKGQYVIVDTAELEKLRTESDKSVTVDTFVPSDAIDPVYHSGKTYYLVPDGPIGQKPYALIRQSMVEEGLHAVAKVVMSGKEQLVLLRPIEQLLGMTVLEYDTRVKKPSAFEDELQETESSEEELKLTKTLMGALVREDFDIAQYKDVYTERLAQLIEAKVEGKELVAPPAVQEPHVINLMEALKESVKRVQPSAKAKQPAAARKKPAPKKAASARERTAATPKKKKKSS